MLTMPAKTKKKYTRPADKTDLAGRTTRELAKRFDDHIATLKPQTNRSKVLAMLVEQWCDAMDKKK